jgi:hypothetical protein
MDINKTEQTKAASDALWAKRIKERKQSGKSIRQYCQEQGLKEWQYYDWQSKLHRPTPTLKGFVELKAKPAFGRIVVEIEGCNIQVQEGFDAETLREIISALRRL